MSHSIKPQSHELEEAKRTVEEALQAAKAVAGKDENLEVELGWTGDEYTVERLGGVSGFTHSPTRVEIKFNTNAENWKNFLKATTAHEYAHTLFFETHREDIIFNWQDILFEAHSQHFAEKIFPDIQVPWREKYSEEELAENWESLKDVLSKEIDPDRSMMYGKGSFPEWIGYCLAYRIGEKLLEKRELDELPELNRSDVIEAGDKLLE